jgi:oligopeptide/dipeptide ABC transporter ATP-binding protein
MPNRLTENHRTDERRTYWPRFGPAVPPPDFAEDRHCTNCGYNLRGLAYNDACPECGSVRGMSPSDEPLPFDEKSTLWNYFATLMQIFVDPQHPYTWGLFNSIPPMTGARMKRLVSIPGAPPSLLDLLQNFVQHCLPEPPGGCSIPFFS